jgi:hypothetical protein
MKVYRFTIKVRESSVLAGWRNERYKTVFGFTIVTNQMAACLAAIK